MKSILNLVKLIPRPLGSLYFKRLFQKSELPLFYSSPTTKAVGSNFVTSIEPTALVVGALHYYRLLRIPLYGKRK